MAMFAPLSRPAAPAADGALVPLERSVGYHVRQLAETWQDAMDRCAAAHGVTISQWRYLRELWEEDGLSTGELTRRVGRQGPTTVVAVQLLEKAGLVTVAKSAEDRRKSFIHLTRRGQRLAAAMSPLIRDVNEQAMARFDRERNPHLQAAHRPHPANARCRKRKPQRLVRAAHAAIGRGGRTIEVGR